MAKCVGIKLVEKTEAVTYRKAPLGWVTNYGDEFYWACLVDCGREFKFATHSEAVNFIISNAKENKSETKDNSEQCEESCACENDVRFDWKASDPDLVNVIVNDSFHSTICLTECNQMWEWNDDNYSVASPILGLVERKIAHILAEDCNCCPHDFKISKESMKKARELRF